MIYSLCMEIIFINEAKDPMMYRFKKDYQAILILLIDILFVILVAHSSYSKPHCKDCDGDCAHCKFYGGE